jgi:hypothetical protein
MSKQTIFLGQTANDRTGDPLRVAFEKVNANFTELYAGAAAEDRLTNGVHQLVLNVNGATPYVTFPAINGDYTAIQGSEIAAFGSGIFLTSAESDVILSANAAGTRKNWTFGTDSKLTLPTDGSIQQNFVETKVTESNIILNASSGVIWTATHVGVSGVKLIIQAEIDETGDATGWHSQVCEAIVASRGYATSASGPLGDPQMTVYGVTHTSTDPLITFTVQRDPITKLIEVVGTRTATALSSARVDFRIHSVQMSTSD